MTKENGKMDLTFNQNTYGILLTQYRPKVITTEAENEQAISLAQELEHRQNLTPEEKTFLELLVTLIEKFENENYPIPQGSSQNTLRHLIQENDLNQEDLVNILGSESVVMDIINGTRNMSKLEAQFLANFFNIDV